MPTLEQWGPATWTLFHCLAAKLHPESFTVIGKQLLFFFIQIAGCLPCPECTVHAKAFFAKLNHSLICSSIHLQNMLYAFHNIVNRRKIKPLFNHSFLCSTYEKMHIITVLDNFFRFFHTRGNLSMISDSFHRQRVLLHFRRWLRGNISQHFSVAPFSSTFSSTYNNLPTISKDSQYTASYVKLLLDGNKEITETGDT